MYRIFVLACFVAGIHAGVWSFGRCPDVTVQECFDISQYVGKWYELNRYPNIYDKPFECVTDVVALDGNTVTINHEGYLSGSVYYDVTATATQDELAFPAKITLKYNDLSPFVGYIKRDYWVISTDYTSYSIVWSCRPFFFFFLNIQNAWLLSRENQKFSSETLATINGILTTNKIRTDEFETTPHSTCGIQPG